MTDVLDPASMIEAAQTAAAAGDYLAAERLLREVAAIQEASLGALHPELASTLNNLAFVCERTNKIVEAERGYRRAHAIAVASLGPRHPFVVTSVKNLVDFCAANGIPIWTPPGAQSGAETTSAGPKGRPYDTSDPAAEQQRPVRRTGPTTPTRPTRTIALAALGVASVVAVLFAMRWSGTSSASGSPARSSRYQRCSTVVSASVSSRV